MAPTELNERALALLVEQGIAKPGEDVILTRGDHMNAHGGTNTLKILEVGRP
ncbi:pyruvate kinase alpha/beta domain-containing protein [Halomonas sp. ANAO-440]|uniref:pyruvate kinase alpha/beta domain-containing protein n=1 Tax=Halomonas sp. ANAO-440 TaxID=2861360 RepID=UPI003977553E